MIKRHYLKTTLAALLTAALAACGGDSSSSGGLGGGGGNGGPPTPIEPAPPLPGNPDALPQVTYPLPNMTEVPITAQAMLRYSDSVYEQAGILDNIGLTKEPSGIAEEVEVSVTLADQGRTVVVTPATKLEPFTRYALHRGFTDDEEPDFEDQIYINYYFTTGGDPDGDQDARSYDASEMAAEETKPGNPSFGAALQLERILAWSPLRLIHTQPVDPDTVHYGNEEGDNLRLNRNDNGEFIDADTFVDGRNIVVVPVEPLDPTPGYSFTYSGQTGSAVESIYDQPFTPLNQTAQEIFPTATDPGWEVTYQGTNFTLPEQVDAIFGDTNQNSPWTDRWVNALAGNADADLDIDLAYIPGSFFTSPIYHFRVRKDTLAGESVEPIARNLGEDAGTVEVTFPTDVTGFLVLVNEGILGRLYTYLNVALEGEEPRFVATEMAVYATIDESSGDMTLEMVGALDPALLGQERLPGNGMFTFQVRIPNALSE